MNNTINSTKVIALTLTALLFASIFWLLNERSINSTLEEGLASEKLRSESLLAEKLLLEKDIAKFKDQMSSLTGQNQELDKILKQTSQKLEAKEAEFSRVNKENASLQKIKKQQNELLAIRKDLDAQIENLKATLQGLQAENNTLNNKVAFLEQRNKLLNDELHKAMLASIDHTQTDALQGKSERLTVKAKRTNKLVANFEVPAELKNLSFRVISPTGSALSPKDGTIASRVVSTTDDLVASSAATTEVSSKLKKVEMVYIPSKKLVAGTYKIEILNDNLYVGSLQVKLR